MISKNIYLINLYNNYKTIIILILLIEKELKKN